MSKLNYGDLINFRHCLGKVTEDVAEDISIQMLGAEVEDRVYLLDEDQKIIIYKATVEETEYGFDIIGEATVVSKQRCKNAKEAISKVLEEAYK